MPNELTPVTSELRMLEQIHMALGSAHKLDDFYAIVAGLMVTPDSLGFSRAFIIRYDERTKQYTGKMALGASTQAEHERFRNDQRDEQASLQKQIADAERESPEPAAIQQLYDLRFHGLWVQLLQGQEEGTGLNSGFQQLRLNTADLPDNHILTLVAESSHAAVYEPGSVDLTGLEPIIKLPIMASRLKTRNGLHGLIFADKLFEDNRPLDNYSLLRFQSFVNHVSVSLDNVELVEDLTRGADRMREVDRIKMNFLNIVSHELRTPLTSIVGFIHLLRSGRSGELNEAQTNLLDRVANHSVHLQSMVNDLLEIAEVESGGMLNVEPRAIDPLASLMNVIPRIESRRSTREVTVEPIVNNHIPNIYTDANALERIYYHLLDNAIKFIPESGRVTIEFQTKGKNLDIIVADTGIGISQENLKQIFDHFYQVDFRLERSYGGMGIGLTIVKLLLDATGGTLKIESHPGQGSRFIITYPLAN